MSDVRTGQVCGGTAEFIPSARLREIEETRTRRKILGGKDERVDPKCLWFFNFSDTIHTILLPRSVDLGIRGTGEVQGETTGNVYHHSKLTICFLTYTTGYIP